MLAAARGHIDDIAEHLGASAAHGPATGDGIRGTCCSTGPSSRFHQHARAGACRGGEHVSHAFVREDTDGIAHGHWQKYGMGPIIDMHRDRPPSSPAGPFSDQSPQPRDTRSQPARKHNDRVPILIYREVPYQAEVRFDVFGYAYDAYGVIFKNVSTVANREELLFRIIPDLAGLCGLASCPTPVALLAQHCFPAKNHYSLFVRYATPAGADLLVAVMKSIKLTHLVAGRRIYAEHLYLDYTVVDDRARKSLTVSRPLFSLPALKHPIFRYSSTRKQNGGGRSRVRACGGPGEHARCQVLSPD
jgi:hypothetical protein